MVKNMNRGMSCIITFKENGIYDTINYNIRSFEKYIKYMDKFSKIINEIQEDCKDGNKANIYKAMLFVEIKKDFVDIFLNGQVCPPIFYFIDNIFKMTTNEACDYICNSSIYLMENVDNIDGIIYSEDIKEYYCLAMDEWAEEEHDNSIKAFIKEIQSNFYKDNIYTTTLSLFTLIEYKVRNVYGKDIKANEITKTIRNILEEQCFKYEKVPNKELMKIYTAYLERRSKSDIYKSTDKNPEYITRHIVHGVRMDLINKKEMLSLVFLTDCIYKMLFNKYN